MVKFNAALCLITEIQQKFISFTLYSAHSRIGRGNLELRHSVSHFPSCVWSGGTQRRALPRRRTPEHRNKNINVNKYYISSSEYRTQNQSILQTHFVPLRHNRSKKRKILIPQAEIELKFPKTNKIKTHNSTYNLY